MHQPLVPTRIVNKNGVPTTVHKKPKASAAAAAASHLPAPDLSDAKAPTSGTAKMMRRIEKLIGHWYGYVPPALKSNQIEQKLEALPDRIKELLAESAAKNEEDTSFDQVVASMLHMSRSYRDMDDVLFCYDNTGDYENMVINKEWSEFGFDVEYGIIGHLEWARAYNDRLSGYEFRVSDNPLPLREYDKKTQAQVIALVDATNYFGESGNFSVTEALEMVTDASGDRMLQIRDTNLAQLLVDKPERYEDIMRLIDERFTLDADLIRSIIDNAAQPMNNGIL